jgi:hypothetical protein
MGLDTVSAGRHGKQTALRSATEAKGERMSDLPELLKRRDKRAFVHWDGFVPSEMVSKSEVAIGRLIDRLVALGPEPTREQL